MCLTLLMWSGFWSYRGLVKAILVMISWTFTASIDQTAVITVVYAILATAGYYWHDRF